MSNELPEWPRPKYEAGGGAPFLFYVVFGPVPSEISISSSQYRCAGIPAGVEILAYGPESNPEVVNQFRDGYLWDELHHHHSELAELVSKQNECLVIRGDPSDYKDLNYFRDTVGVIQWLLDSGGVAVYDPQSFQWWAPSDWRKHAFESSLGSPRHHVTILTSEEKEGEWMHTRGLRKFGRPDLSIHKVLPDFREQVIDMLNRFIEFQAFGGVVKEKEIIRIAELPAGMRCYHRGDMEDPDFNNVHIEIEWPREQVTVNA